MEMIARKTLPPEVDENWHFDVGAECTNCGSIGVWIDEDIQYEYCDRCGQYN